jgi:hypothetical protein
LHWDRHDTLILQVAGCKHWTVYEPTRLHPVDEDPIAPDRPHGTPVWTGVLEQGSILFMPRGWWHIVRALDGPSLHLTLGITAPTGEHLLKWLVREQLVHEDVRADVPFAATRDVQAQYVARLRQRLDAAWTDDVLERYGRYAEGKVTPRPAINLPDGIGADRITPLTGRSRIRATSPIVLSDDDVTCTIGDRRWTLDADLGHSLRLLARRAESSVSELCAEIDARLTPRLKALLLELLRKGQSRA